MGECSEGYFALFPPFGFVARFFTVGFFAIERGLVVAMRQEYPGSPQLTRETRSSSSS
jgi:hypothetical protein